MVRELLVSNSLLRGHTLQAALDVIASFGPASLDFYAASPHLSITLQDKPNTDRLAEALKHHGLTLRCFTPAAYRYDLCYSPESPAGRASLLHFSRAIDAADALNAELVVLIAGRGEADIDMHQRQQHVLENLQRLTKQQHHAKLAVEIPFCEPSENAMWQPSFLSQMANALPSIHFAFNTRMLLLSLDGWQQWLQAAEGRIAIIRLADGHWHGEKTWGEGIVHIASLKDILQASSPTCWVSTRLHTELDAQTAEEWYIKHLHAAQAEMETNR